LINQLSKYVYLPTNSNQNTWNITRGRLPAIRQTPIKAGRLRT